MSSNSTTEKRDAFVSALQDKLTSNRTTWQSQHLLSVTQIAPSGLRLLFRTALAMRNLVQNDGGGDVRFRHCILATVFYEASTRTSCSFQAAMYRLGGKVIHVDAGTGGNTSANKKGESLSDTIRSLESYTDVTVLRHPIKGSVIDVASQCSKPVINAGDGVGEHPTQALLDLFTIQDELGLFHQNKDSVEKGNDDKNHNKKHLVIVLLGDLKNGRTVHSLAKLVARSGMNQSYHITLRYCSPSTLGMPQYVKDYVSAYDGVTQQECNNVQDAIQGANVLYVTRVQRERFENVEDYEKVKDAYVVDTDLMKSAPSNNMIVMHPLPRVNEISTEVDSDPRAAYFRQMENGMYVRMAILALILGKV